MRFNSLRVENFRAISKLELSGLGDVVVLAGPNGCGKSCVLDAIRLLKSAYGGYQPNEWQTWFGEFQINFSQRPEDLLSLLQDRSIEMRIALEVGITERERQYLSTHAEELVRQVVWQEVVPEIATWRSFYGTSFASQYRAHSPEVEEKTATAVAELREEIDNATHLAELVVVPVAAQAQTAPSRTLELLFSLYDPQNIGVVDYHGPTRTYAREQVGGISLDVQSVEAQRRQTALYNPQAKYANLKTEMASVLVRRLLSEDAGAEAVDGASLVESLKELFATFFPSKTFLGPQPTPDGRVSFPVRLENGAVHDLDELSAGEKEVLYGYLRLRNMAPRDSVILLDEPELHLNPRLIRGLARFYYNHLIKPNRNQLWLLTHSDTLLRESVGSEGFRVFHMQIPTSLTPGENQVREVTADDQVERLVIELVGDLAAYRPGAKVVIFEGGGDIEFDVRMTSLLFPEFIDKVNSVAGGNRAQVRALHEVLEKSGSLGARFYSISDQDASELPPATESRAYSWDRYHVENYLLQEEYILKAARELSSSSNELSDVSKTKEALREAARETLPVLVRHRLIQASHNALIREIRVGAQRENDLIEELVASISGSLSRARQLAETTLSRAALESTRERTRKELESDLESDQWLLTFRGRDVLKRFIGRFVRGVGYEVFRDLVVARMRDDGYQPPGMQEVLGKILADPFP